MVKISTTKQFEKEVLRMKKQGKNIEKLVEIMEKLANTDALPAKNRNHKLKGDFVGRWECHIEPNWLLVYKKMKNEIRFERTGSHSELFK